jgi:hypothetical protein
MKAKNRKKYLTGKQAWWDKLPKDVQAATTRPGSVKTA